MSTGQDKDELEVFIVQTANPQIFSLTKDVLPTAAWLMEYEFIRNNNTAGVADDMYLILNYGELAGGTAVASNNQQSFVGSNEVPLSTAQLTDSGPQRFQYPYLLAKDTRTGRRRFEFSLKNDAGGVYVPVDPDWKAMYRIKYVPLAVGRPSMNLRVPHAQQSWAMATN